jgi:hypothetical protein
LGEGKLVDRINKHAMLCAENRRIHAMTMDEFMDTVNGAIGGWRTYEPEDTLSVKWVTGGITGGNCWGDSAEYAVTAEPEPEFRDLDVILEAVVPNISFVAYKKLVNELVETDSDTEYEWYGNYTHYAQKKVNLLDLYNQLKTMKLI